MKRYQEMLFWPLQDIAWTWEEIRYFVSFWKKISKFSIHELKWIKLQKLRENKKFILTRSSANLYPEK